MPSKIKVGLIFGGKSGEHEVSLASANSVAQAIDHDKYSLVLIGVTKDGNWSVGPGALKQLVTVSPSPLLIAAKLNDDAKEQSTQPVSSKALVPAPGRDLSNSSPLASVDVVFPLVHGTNGEDGTIQGLLELADIPYVGAGVAASAVGMDKALMKSVFGAHGMPQVNWIVVTRREWEERPDATISRIERAISYPCFVKPASLGSSVGISKVHHKDEIAQALDHAGQYDRKILVEQAAQDAREIECSVLGNDNPIASLPGEIVAKREFYDYAAKYEEESGTELIVPADLAPDATRSVQEMAVRAFQAIDCSGMARVDFFLERSTNRLLLNEINTIPGFTAVSMYPRMWEKSGVAYRELIDRLIELALERHADKRRSKTSYR